MTHDELKAKALSRPEVKAEYEALESEFASCLRRSLSTVAEGKRSATLGASEPS